MIEEDIQQDIATGLRVKDLILAACTVYRPEGYSTSGNIFCLQTCWTCALLERRAPPRAHLRKKVTTLANREASMGV